MSADPLNSESSDRLNEFHWPAFFPRTLSASAANPMPAADMKQPRSPDKLMNDANKVVDREVEFLESDLVTRIASKRPGLGISRPRAPFSLKTTVSQPHVSLKPNLDTDQFQDPDEFFDEYERLENAQKEIDKLLGGTSHVANQQRRAPRLRQGILGKSYNYKHRYSSASSEIGNVPSPPQKLVEDGISNPLEGGPLENVISQDFIPAVDVENGEPAGKRTENSSNLDELLSFSNGHLIGDGTLHHLQQRLNIKSLDLDSLVTREPDYSRRPSTLIAGESPFSSVSLLMKRIVKPNPLKDPFFPHDAEHSSCQKVSLVQPSDKLHQQVVESDDLRMHDFGSQAEAEIAEPIISNSDSLKMTETKDNYPHQVVNEETGGPYGDNCIIPYEEPGSNIQESDNNNSSHNRENPMVSSLEYEAVEGKSACSQNESEPHPEVRKRKLNVSDRAGQNRIRKAHPLRKSLAGCGSSFVTGVRRSTRIKMRPLEYWKGERFLYGRVGNSLKLIGVKYSSPGKGDNTLKVRSYMSSDSAEIKELLDLESRY